MLAFARALLERWDRRVISPRPLGLVFRRPATPARTPARGGSPASLHRHFRNTVHVDLQPRIALTVVRPAGPRESTTLRERSAAATLERERFERLVLRNTSAVAAERVVERVLSRARRVDVALRPPATTAVQRPDAPLDSPPALVVQRAPVAPSAAPARAAEAPKTAAAGAPDPALAAALDLGQITDRVVSAIDHRLAAQAERLGRG